MKRTAVGVLAALFLISIPIDETAETIRRDFHYRTRGMVRLLFFWVGKDDVGGGRISFLESEPNRGGRWKSDIEVLFGSRPEMADKSKALYEGTITLVGMSQANARMWWFQGSRSDTYQDPKETTASFVALRDAEADIERTLMNKNVYAEPYGFLTAVQAFVQEILRAEASDMPLSSIEAKKPYVHNARLYTLTLEKAKLRETFKLSDEQRHERVLELKMKTLNSESGKTHAFTLFVATKGRLRGIPLRIEDKPRWWLKVRQDLTEERPPSHEVVETNR